MGNGTVDTRDGALGGRNARAKMQKKGKKRKKKE